MSGTIFVTGAAGTTGRELVRLLTDHDVEVRAGVHTPSKAPEFDDRVDVRGIDFGDRESLVDAFVELQEWFEAGNGHEVFTDAEALTGAPTTPFETFATDYAAHFRTG